MRNFFLFVFSLAATLVYGQSSEKMTLEAGTVVPVIAKQQINVHKLKSGQTIELVTAHDVLTKDGRVAIPMYAKVIARVRTTLRDHVPTVSRRVIIDIQKVVLDNSKEIPLTDGVIRFTPRTENPEPGLVPLKVYATNRAYIPTYYEMQPKVEVTQILE
ncbi:MAG: hypothetical protein IKP52_06880 [Prevotella sp.]|jgi:hypothetical protein|nr:hypothetical protein [Prevotella sp.]MBR7049428.1 hypothetical protein [Prevotella sp.]